MASSTASEIWSAILSGWPSVTDSEVNVVFTGSSASHALVGDRPVEYRIRPLHPWRSRRSRCCCRPPRGWRPHWCRGRIPLPGARDVVDDQQVDPLAAAISRGRARPRRWSRPRNPTSTWPGRRRATRPVRMSGVGSSTSSGSPSSLESLRSAATLGRKSATAAAMTTTSASRHGPSSGRLHVGGALHVDPGHRRPHVAGKGERRRGDQRHRRTPAGRRFGQRVPLLARGPVGQIAHRVERLAGAARAHHHPESRPGRRAPPTPTTQEPRRPGRARRWRPDRPDGPRPNPRRPDRPTAGGTMPTPRRSKVARFSRTDGCSHISVCMAGQTSTGARVASSVAVKQVVGEAGGVAGDEVGRGRRHDDQVGALPEAGVGDRRVLVPQRGLRRLGGQRRERHRADEAGGLAGEDRDHVRPGVHQAAGTPRPPCRRRCPRRRPGRHGDRASAARAALRPSSGIRRVPIRLTRGRVPVPDVESVQFECVGTALPTSPTSGSALANTSLRNGSSSMSAVADMSACGRGRGLLCDHLGLGLGQCGLFLGIGRV